MANAPNRIAEWRKKRNKTQQQLADAIGAHWITISKLERGKLQLTHEWLDKIADALRVAGPALLHMEDQKATIYVDSVVANGETFGLATSDEDLPLQIVTNLRTSLSGLWSLVIDNSMYPLFRPGDVIRMSVVLGHDDEPYENYLNRICVVRPVDIERRVMGILERGDKPDRFTLRPLSGPPLVNIGIHIMAIVEQAFFQPKLSGRLRTEMEENSRSAK